MTAFSGKSEMLPEPPNLHATTTRVSFCRERRGERQVMVTHPESNVAV